MWAYTHNYRRGSGRQWHGYRSQAQGSVHRHSRTGGGTGIAVNIKGTLEQFWAVCGVCGVCNAVADIRRTRTPHRYMHRIVDAEAKGCHVDIFNPYKNCRGNPRITPVPCRRCSSVRTSPSCNRPCVRSSSFGFFSWSCSCRRSH